MNKEVRIRSGSDELDRARQDSASQLPDRTQRRRLHLYLLPFVLFPLLLLISAFFIIPTHWFVLHTGNTYLANLGYGARLANHSCEVLIYGDSSAMVGVDPALIQQETGLTTCNIAEFEGITLTGHTSLVDTFLLHNPRPRFLVFLYTPEDFSIPRDWASFNVGTFEAVTFMLEYERSFKTAVSLALHPTVTLGWAEEGLRLALEHIRSKPLRFERAHLRESTHGQLPVETSGVASCDNDRRDRLPDPAWIAYLRSHYAEDGTRVIVDATPTVSCDPSLGFFQQHLDGLIDDTPYEPIPVSSYSDDGRLHANRKGAQLLSAMIAGQIMRLSEGSANLTTHGKGDH